MSDFAKTLVFGAVAASSLPLTQQPLGGAPSRAKKK